MITSKISYYVMRINSNSIPIVNSFTIKVYEKICLVIYVEINREVFITPAIRNSWDLSRFLNTLLSSRASNAQIVLVRLPETFAEPTPQIRIDPTFANIHSRRGKRTRTLRATAVPRIPERRAEVFYRARARACTSILSRTSSPSAFRRRDLL